MGDPRGTYLLLYLGLVFRSSVVEAANTFRMTWSSQKFGPDRPWQAVEIRIGSSKNVVSLYPGGVFASHILSPNICTNATLGSVCYAQTAGLYDDSLSSTAAFGSVSLPGDVGYSGGALQLEGTIGRIGTDTWDIGNDMETLQGMDMTVHDSIWGTLLDEWLMTEALPNKVLSSNSYGLHIGSVSPKISPSLVFGGFDQYRVLGAVSTQQGSLDSVNSIDMLDISLTVVEGASPWTFNNLGGLLASGNSSINGVLPVAINSLASYLHLPKSTCDAIAANLPVTYQPKYGLYFWNTEDPQYGEIVSSASFLSFTFRESQSASKLTINVPFKLLNLSLTAPLTTTPKLYFPCKAEAQTHYQLGRAFLKAAFVGVNWDAFNGSAAWWLAQAPGPNILSQASVIVIGDTDTTIAASTFDWNSSWKDYWTILSANENATTKTAPGPSSAPSSGVNGTANPAPSTGLSSGAKAGIGVGIAAGVLVVLIVSFFLWRKSRKSSPAHYAAEAQQIHSS